MSSNNYNPLVPPPAYSTYDASAPTQRRRLSSSDAAATPAHQSDIPNDTTQNHHGQYTYRIEENEEAAGSPPPYASEAHVPVRASKEAPTQRRQQACHNSTPISTSDSSQACSSSSASNTSPAGSAPASTSKSTFGSTASSFFRSRRQAHEERRREKESRKLVDFYEKQYGFVPKNVMTEAEWRATREAMPVTKTKGSFKARPGVLF